VEQRIEEMKAIIRRDGVSYTMEVVHQALTDLSADYSLPAFKRSSASYMLDLLERGMDSTLRKISHVYTRE
jgi:hypothetical protein